MTPGKKRGIFIAILLVVLFILGCSPGCIQPTNSNSGQVMSYSSQATPGPAAIGSSATKGPEDPGTTLTAQIEGVASQVDNQTTGNVSIGAKYAAGSSVQKNPGDSSFDKDRGFVIVKVNDNVTYTVGQIYFDPEVKVWFKVNEELLVSRVIHAAERDYPVLKGTVDWSNFPTKHGVVDQYGTTRLEW